MKTRTPLIEIMRECGVTNRLLEKHSRNGAAGTIARWAEGI